MRGGRIGVTQGRDEDAPTMTPKKKKKGYSFAISQKRITWSVIAYVPVQEFQKKQCTAKPIFLCKYYEENLDLIYVPFYE